MAEGGPIFQSCSLSLIMIHEPPFGLSAVQPSSSVHAISQQFKSSAASVSNLLRLSFPVDFRGMRKVIRPDQNNLSKRRRWDEMDHDVLVNTMKRLSWWDWEMDVLKLCKPWLLAALAVAMFETV
ncbi:hypothetical protein CCACVL1_14116 [Corchorus capsularis]|uniref:Uncharacterized protein n=1 Tax=Corchorus capsularis TaxID=210143 RepID=A0A1R3I840_COCAP|nr:hypothetical protein CCACVL1_14116 [Corchorus capsularis]